MNSALNLIKKLQKEVDRRNSAYDYYGMGNTIQKCFPEEWAVLQDLIELRNIIATLPEDMKTDTIRNHLSRISH